MAKTIILLRHGQTDGNKRQIIQGMSNSHSLNSLGNEQMEKALSFLQSTVPPFKLWHSPQQRVRDSALIIKTHAIKVSETIGLSQRNWGSATGNNYNKYSGEAAFLGNSGAPLAEDAECLQSISNRLRKVVSNILLDPHSTHVILGSNEILNYLHDLFYSKPFRKSSFLSGEALILELDQMNNVNDKKYYPERIALLVNTSSITEEPEAIKILRSSNIKIAAEVDATNKDGVVAIILGDKNFSLDEAKEFHSLRTVARFGSGANNVGFEKLWSERRICTTRVSGASDQEVAEFAFSLITLALRKFPTDCNALKQETPHWRAAGRGKALREAKVGIIGMGRIGQRVASLLNQCGSEVIAWNRSWPPKDHGIDLSFVRKASSIEEIAQKCDAMSLHLSLAEDTHHFLGEDFFNAIRSAQNSLALVNSARGALCEPDALLAGLNEGIINSACIDVWNSEGSQEPSDTEREIQRHSSVLASSHIAANTMSTRKAYAVECAKNVVAAVEGRYSEINPRNLLPQSIKP